MCHQVKVLFVRKLATPVTEELLEKTFSAFGKLERVKKLKDYAFVHFEDRDAAVKVGYPSSLFLSKKINTFYLRMCDTHFLLSSGNVRNEWEGAGGRGD